MRPCNVCREVQGWEKQGLRGRGPQGTAHAQRRGEQGRECLAVRWREWAEWDGRSENGIEVAASGKGG